MSAEHPDKLPRRCANAHARGRPLPQAMQRARGAVSFIRLFASGVAMVAFPRRAALACRTAAYMRIRRRTPAKKGIATGTADAIGRERLNSTSVVRFATQRPKPAAK